MDVDPEQNDTSTNFIVSSMCSGHIIFGIELIMKNRKKRSPYTHERELKTGGKIECKMLFILMNRGQNDKMSHIEYIYRFELIIIQNLRFLCLCVVLLLLRLRLNEENPRTNEIAHICAHALVFSLLFVFVFVLYALDRRIRSDYKHL